MTKYIYATASIKLPICFIVKSLSKDASRVQTNWMGYIAVATDQGKAMLGRRDIVVAWRGTLQPYEWANDFDFPLESAISVFPVTDPKDNPRIGSGWLDIYTASDSRSPYDTTSAQEQVLAFLFYHRIHFCAEMLWWPKVGPVWTVLLISEHQDQTRTVPNLSPLQAMKKPAVSFFGVPFPGSMQSCPGDKISERFNLSRPRWVELKTSRGDPLQRQQHYFHFSFFLLMASCLGFGFRYKES